MRIGILGCGRWATFLAWYADRCKHSVTLWGRPDSVRLKALRETRCNETIALPSSVALTDRLSDLGDCDLLLVSVAAQSLREVLTQWVANSLPRKPFVLCMKGLETDSCLRLSQVAAEVLGADWPVAVWLGPGHPQDFLADIPNCMVIDSDDSALKKEVVSTFSGQLIRMYYGTDMIGNELGAAAKNIIGIAAGLLDGSGRGSLKGALMARGAHEISRLTVALGGDERSTYGLCHLGDYEATLFSPYSHNRLFGEHFIQDKPYDQLAEGYKTVPAFIELARRCDVELPICQAVYDILYRAADGIDVLNRLFTRQLKNEF